jgi:hypothetical protein
MALGRRGEGGGYGATAASLVRPRLAAYCSGMTDGALSARRKCPERRFPEAVVLI